MALAPNVFARSRTGTRMNPESQPYFRRPALCFLIGRQTVCRPLVATQVASNCAPRSASASAFGRQHLPIRPSWVWTVTHAGRRRTILTRKRPLADRSRLSVADRPGVAVHVNYQDFQRAAVRAV